MFNLNRFILLFIFISISPLGLTAQFKIGLIADCQFADKTSEIKKYSSSLSKLESAVSHFNNEDIEMAFHLGDFIDEGFSNYNKLLKITEKLNKPLYHVLGNHDFSVEEAHKEKVPLILGMKNRYYTVEKNDFKVIVLDSTDLSIYAHSKDHPKTIESIRIHSEKFPDKAQWIGGISKEQFTWIETELIDAQKKEKKVILMSHHPIFPSNSYNIWNDYELLQLFAQYKNVVAYINGHDHRGNYGVFEGIHFLTLKGMVNTDINSYAIAELKRDRMIIHGVGREEDRIMNFK
jgi:predicted phosphodiesterase